MSIRLDQTAHADELPISGAVEDVLNADLCLGCGACAVAFDKTPVRIQLAADGFLRPVSERSLTAEESAEFSQFCPGVRLAHPHRDASFHALWGPLRQIATGYAADEEVRFKGSSGGGLSALMIHLLETGSVQGVVHVAPSPDHPFENVVQISTTREAVLAAAGSRYAPASPLAALNDCLARPGVFAFVGKPCDVAALRALQRLRPQIRKKFPYVLSFMCAGTPSFKGTDAVVERMGFRPQEVVRFRYRGDGWPGMARAETADGRVAEMGYDASWGQVLNRHLQFRCKICPDGTGEFADVTCADAWYGDEHGYPSFEEAAGRSLVLARTEQGERLIGAASAAGALIVEPLAVEEIARMQPYQRTRKGALLARLFGLKMALRKTPRYRALGLWAAARQLSPKVHLKNALGTWMRVVGVRR